MWQASGKHFNSAIEAETSSNGTVTQRAVGATERAAKIKSFEQRNNAVLEQRWTPAKSLWEALAAGKDAQEFTYIPIEKIASEMDQEKNRQ